MSGHRIPRNTEQATAMLERYAVLADQIAHIDGVRNRLISQANANADASAEALLTEQDVIREKVEAWWAKAGPDLTKGKRKSIELGGCMVGTVQGRDYLGMPADEDVAIAWLQKRAWAEPLLRVKVSIEKKAVLDSIDGCYSRQLSNLGFKRGAGIETFYVKRTEQRGTITEAAA